MHQDWIVEPGFVFNFHQEKLPIQLGWVGSFCFYTSNFIRIIVSPIIVEVVKLARVDNCIL